MPKFSESELEEIRHNTERIEKERAAKQAARAGGSGKKDPNTAKKPSPRKRKKTDHTQTLQERLIAPLLLLVTLLISALVFFQ
jgi:uncharacterized protein YhaN